LLLNPLEPVDDPMPVLLPGVFMPALEPVAAPVPPVLAPPVPLDEAARTGLAASRIANAGAMINLFISHLWLVGPKEQQAWANDVPNAEALAAGAFLRSAPFRDRGIVEE